MTLDKNAPGKKGRIQHFSAWLIEFISVQMPRALTLDFPLVADAISDGTWTAAWRFAACLPILAFSLGLAAPMLSGGISTSYTASLLLIVLFISGAILSGAVGVSLVSGFAIGAIIVAAMRVQTLSAHSVWTEVPQLFISTLAFSLPTIFIPRVAHGFVPLVPRHLTDGAAQTNFWRAALYAASCAILVFAWCRGLPTMLRPVASLATGTEARNISPITWSWPVVVAAAAIAGFARIILEGRVMAGPHGPEIIELKRKLYSGHRRRGLLRYVPKFIRRLASTLFLLFIFGGTFSSWADILVIGLLIGIVFAARSRLINHFPDKWIERITRIPVLVRFLSALIFGYLFSAVIISAMWSEASMRSVTLSTLISLTLFALFFPEGAQVARSTPERALATAGASLACTLMGFLFGSSIEAHAQGFYHGQHGIGFARHSLHTDDPSCSGLTDCYASPSSAAATSSSTAALGAIATPGILNSGSTTTARSTAADDSAWNHHVQDTIHQSKPTADGGVHELNGSGQSAWATFSRFAQPGSIHPHPNSSLATAGGYLAEMAGGTFIGYRPFTKSGPPAIDLHGVSGSNWLKKLKIVA
jgi:hypothetical protein